MNKYCRKHLKQLLFPSDTLTWMLKLLKAERWTVGVSECLCRCVRMVVCWSKMSDQFWHFTLMLRLKSKCADCAAPKELRSLHTGCLPPASKRTLYLVLAVIEKYMISAISVLYQSDVWWLLSRLQWNYKNERQLRNRMKRVIRQK